MSDKKTELDEQEYRQKRVVFYQTFINAWIENRMEMDRRVLILSSAAIGFLTTYHDELEGIFQHVLLFLAYLLFIFSIITVLFIFRNNAKYIECVISENDEFNPEKNVMSEEKKRLEKNLQLQTQGALSMFIIGIILTFVLVVAKSGFIVITIQGV